MKVIKATKRDLMDAVELAYSLQIDEETRCRPFLIDVSKDKLYELFLRH